MTTIDRDPADNADVLGAHTSPEFIRLRHRLHAFAFPVTGLGLAWYLLYVVLGDYAHWFMSIKVIGAVNIGLLFGLAQFVSTFVITGVYLRYAARRLDPLADRIRADLEAGA